jgi:hypothetical protein
MSLRALPFRGTFLWPVARRRYRLRLPPFPGFLARNQSPQPEREPPCDGESWGEFAAESSQAAHELATWEWDWIDLGGEG